MLLLLFLVEQGRRNDLTLKRRQLSPTVPRGSPETSSKRLADNASHVSSLNIVSERDHCNPLTQLTTVLSGFSCHIRDNLLETEKMFQIHFLLASLPPLPGFMYSQSLVQLRLFARGVLPLR